MKLRLRTVDGATFEAEGPDAFVVGASTMFQRIVLEAQLKECRQRLAEWRTWERGLKRALTLLEEPQDMRRSISAAEQGAGGILRESTHHQKDREKKTLARMDEPV